MKTKHIVIGVLAIGTLVGFGIAASKTNGGKGTATVGGNDYRAQYIPDRSGGYSAIIFVNGVEQEAVVGPMTTVAELDAQVAAYMAGLDVPAFYTVHTDDAGSYYFDGWSRGTKVTTDGPFASEAAANTAGSTWARKAAVPVPSADAAEIGGAAIGARASSSLAARFDRAVPAGYTVPCGDGRVWAKVQGHWKCVAQHQVSPATMLRIRSGGGSRARGPGDFILPCWDNPSGGECCLFENPDQIICGPS